MEQLNSSHGQVAVDGALRLLIARAGVNPASAIIAEEAMKHRLTIRARSEAWDNAVFAVRCGTADVRYCDLRLDGVMKRDLPIVIDAHLVALPADKAKAAKARILAEKNPIEGMKPVGGPAQAQYVADVLVELGRPENAPLAPVTTRIIAHRDALATAETGRSTARSTESAARAELDQALADARAFYNQAYHRLLVLIPDDPAFVESCFSELRTISDGQGAAARKRVLMDVYRARFGAVPREVQAAVTEALDDEQFAELIALFATKSAEEIAKVVLAGKKPEKG